MRRGVRLDRQREVGRGYRDEVGLWWVGHVWVVDGVGGL